MKHAVVYSQSDIDKMANESYSMSAHLGEDEDEAAIQPRHNAVRSAGSFRRLSADVFMLRGSRRLQQPPASDEAKQHGLVHKKGGTHKSGESTDEFDEDAVCVDDEEHVALAEDAVAQPPPLGHPSLLFARYRQRYGLDVFSLPHNGIRKEILDAYTALSFFQVRPLLTISINDYLLLKDFLPPIFRFIKRYLLALEKLVFPWIQSSARVLPQVLESQANARAWLDYMIPEFKELLSRLVVPIDMQRQNQPFHNRIALEAAWECKPKLDQLVGALNSHFLLLENAMSNVVQRTFSRTEKSAFDQRFSAFFTADDVPASDRGLFLCMLSQWMTSREYLTTFLESSNLRNAQKRTQQMLQEWRYDTLSRQWFIKYGSAERRYVGRHVRHVIYFSDGAKFTTLSGPGSIKPVKKSSSMRDLRLERLSTAGMGPHASENLQYHPAPQNEQGQPPDREADRQDIAQSPKPRTSMRIGRIGSFRELANKTK
ncbi:hypothetical protein FVE85_2281 [Porphyridium purpureum]|uniref:Uncharacterized protein n=1 Tax=Porphyridium purpureum TaxID=35688 RepID=A0A5J4YXP1_PORPP|nr:hypothetical protein FVE85_2281 [Porphyridium purpureum]|eukprot:POR7891..scf209_3